MTEDEKNGGTNGKVEKAVLAWISRIVLPVVFLVIGGISVYFTQSISIRSEMLSMDSRHSAAIAEIAVRQRDVIERLKTLESRVRDSDMKIARSENLLEELTRMRSSLETLTKSQYECESLIRQHEESSKSRLPLGRRKSELPSTWKPVSLSPEADVR